MHNLLWFVFGFFSCGIASTLVIVGLIRSEAKKRQSEEADRKDEEHMRTFIRMHIR